MPNHMDFDFFVCPACKSKLTHSKSQSALQCSACDKDYKVYNDIPRFVDDKYCQSFHFEWNTFSKTQLDSYTKTRISYNRFVECTGKTPESLKGKRVLEIGCGAGRFLELLANNGVEVYGVDMSCAVDSASSNLSGFDSVNLAQADLFKLPFKNGSFDFVYSIGVLHHTPDTRKAFDAIVPLVSPGGEIAVYIYGKNNNFIRNIYDNFTSWIILRKIFPLLPAHVAFTIIKYYVPVALFITHIPVIGRVLQRIFPVWDYSWRYPDLSRKLITEWARLDTFDAFTPRYQRRYTWNEVKKWFEENNLTNIRPNKAFVSYTATARND